MKKILVTVITVILVGFNAFAQTGKPAYLLFDKSGQSIGYDTMIKELSKADVVFFGVSPSNLPKGEALLIL